MSARTEEIDGIELTTRSAQFQHDETLHSENENGGSSQPPASDINKHSLLILASSFTLIFTGCGLNFAFGVYQDLYEQLSHQPSTPFTGATPAQIDLIGTFSMALMTIASPLTVSWCRRFDPRSVSIIGGVIFGLACIAASFGTKLWHITLTQGVLVGLGLCLNYMSACTVAPTWFVQHRGLAMGIIMAGTGVGGVVWAPALRAGFDHLGYRNTLRLTGAISTVLMVGGGMMLDWEPSIKARIKAEQLNASSLPSNTATGGKLLHRIPSLLRSLFRVPLLDLRVARTRPFAAQALSAALQSAAYFTPVFFYASYARSLGYTSHEGANFTALSNACNAVGKIVIGYLADRWGRINTLFVTTLLSAVATLAFWVPSTLLGGYIPSSSSQEGSGEGDIRAKALYISFIIHYGIFASAYVALFPTSLIELFGIQHFASVNGVLYMVRGFSTLVGTPLGGALIRGGAAGAGPRSYEGMALLVGLLLFAATLAVGWVRFEAAMGFDGVRRRGWKL